MTEHHWFVKTAETTEGPLSSQQLKEMVLAGRITGETLVRKAPMEHFVPAARVKGLLPQKPEVPPPQASADLFAEPEMPSRNPPQRSPAAELPNRATESIKKVPADKTLSVAFLLDPPEWRNLWPLATSILFLGWVIGGFLHFGRMYAPSSVLPVILLALAGIPMAVAGMLFYLRPLRPTIRSALLTAFLPGPAALYCSWFCNGSPPHSRVAITCTCVAACSLRS